MSTKKLSDEKQKKIREAHGKGMTLEKAGEYAGVNDSTVSKYWHEWGLKAHGTRGKEPIDEETQQKIREAHEKGMSPTEAGEYAGVSRSTVSRYWNGGPIDEETQQKIREAHGEGKNSREAGKDTGVSHSTVLKYWNKGGLKAHGTRGNYNRGSKKLGNIYWDPKEFCNYIELRYNGKIYANLMPKIREVLVDYRGNEPVPDYLVKQSEKNAELKELKNIITLELGISSENS